MADTETEGGPDIEVTEAAGGVITSYEPAALPMLPGEVRPHPTPFQYVMIGLVLVVVTGLEVGLFYLEGDVADGLLVAALLLLAFVKFTLVASWYMHLRTDRPIFRRFFVLGIVAALSLYLIVLLTLHVFD